MREGWAWRRMSDACENLDSKRIPITKSKRVSGGVPYYGASGIVDYVAAHIFDEDLLLVSEDGANLLARTYPIAFSITGKTWVNNHAHVLRFKDRATQRFHEYYLNSISLEPYVSGMAQPKLNQASLNSIPVPSPPLAEQKRIVAILDEAFAGIATAVAHAEKNLANARELFESHLNAVFEQKGEGTKRQPLLALCDVSRGITYGVIKLGAVVPEGVPCLRTSNVRWLRIDIDGMKRISASLSEEYKRTVLRGGEVLVNVRGTLGGVAVASSNMAGWNVSREVAVVPVDAERMLPAFLAYWIGSAAAQRWLSGVQKGVAYTGINLSDLRNLAVPVLCRDEQAEIVRNMDVFRESSVRLEAIYERKLEALAELKQSILQKAFSGELTAAPDTALAEAGL